MATQVKPTITLSHLVDNFLQSRPHLSPGTLASYWICLSNFEWYARKNRWPEDAAEITLAHIRQFLAYVGTESHRWGNTNPSSTSPASPATVHHYGRVIKTMFRWASDEEEYLTQDPTHRLKLGSPHCKNIEPYSDEDVLSMLRACDDEIRLGCRYLGIRNKAIISLFVATGLRLEELSHIKLSHCDPRLQQIRVMGKGAKMRVVPINGEARKSLRRYLEIRPPGGDELWKTADGQAMSRHSIRIMVVRLKRRAGIEGGGGPHRFRHYFATRCLENGMDINSVRLLLGHATLAMVLRYSQYIDVQRALAEHQQYNPLDRLYRGQNHNRNDGWGWRY